MSAVVLISGKLWRDPERKISGQGKAYVAATIRDGDGENAVWWRLLCFSESGCEELLGLRDGDGVAASGGLKAEIYDRGAGARLSLTIFADRVISARRQKREREKERRAEPRQGVDVAEQRPFDDEVGQ